MPSLTSNSAVVKAIAATAATTLVLVGIVLFLFKRFVISRRHNKKKVRTIFLREGDEVTIGEFMNLGGNVKGLIVEENKVDVVYLRKLESGKLETSFPKVVLNPSFEDGKEKRVDFSVEGPRKSRSEETSLLFECSEGLPHEVVKTVLQIPTPPPPPPPPPPFLPVKRSLAPPPPPPKAGNSVSLLKPPPAPRTKANNNSWAEASVEESLRMAGTGQRMLKPLHWDKVIATADHSMVWDKIIDGSFRFEDDVMETLFGYANTKNKSPQGDYVLPFSSKSNTTTPAKIFILEPRKSQNISIVLRSIVISRREIVDALFEGQGLIADTLEKLTKMAPSKEKEAKILQFNGNTNKLADAESFLYHILKVVPFAFTRFNAMLFRTKYDPDILYLKESLQSLGLGCKELRTGGLFLKLLEAILKAGNRMNAGTTRGNAQGFNLSALRKLSDVKSTDGKITLLHFVVEQVVRSEGRRRLINRNHSLGRWNNDQSTDPTNSDSQTAEDRDRESLMLGLPVMEDLSTKLSNVKKATIIEYDNFITMCSTLDGRVAEIRQLLRNCGNDERGVGFVREMKGFLEESEEELKVVRGEQTRVMELVKRTTKYYQAGASISNDKGSHPLQLFVMVKDFLVMVDQVCADISRKIRKKNETALLGSSPPSTKTPWRLPNFHSHFMLDMSRMSSSESDDDL